MVWLSLPGAVQRRTCQRDRLPSVVAKSAQSASLDLARTQFKFTSAQGGASRVYSIIYKINKLKTPCISHAHLTGYHTSQERQPAAVSELPNDQPHQSPKQSRAEDHTEQIEATSTEDLR